MKQGSIFKKFAILAIFFSSCLVSATVSISITEFKPKGTGSNRSISINEADHRNLRLSCQTDKTWYHCQFRHESNGKSCQIDYDWTTKDERVQCSRGITYKGSLPTKIVEKDTLQIKLVRECIVEIEEVGLEDAGHWSCIMSDYYQQEKDMNEFTVQVAPIPPPEISYDYCGIARLVTDNRMKIDLPYDNNVNCRVTLKLPQTKTFKLTIDNFRVSLVRLTTFNESFDNFFIFQTERGHDYLSTGIYTSEVMKTYSGDRGDISYQWSGNYATFLWKTDRSTTYSDMTAYVDF